MFYICKVHGNGMYSVCDTADGVVDKVSYNQLAKFIEMGMSIDGVSIINGELDIRRSSKYYSLVSEETVETVNKSITKSSPLDVLSERQLKVVHDYYIWETVSLYKKLSNNSNLQLKPKKVKALADLAGDAEWAFGGIVDKGVLGGGKCALGHALRYEYYANGSDSSGRRHRIVFGETCASDFFSIPKEDMAKLVKVRQSMSDEIDIIVDCVRNNRYEEMQEGYKFFNNFLSSCFQSGGSALMTSILGKRFVDFITAFSIEKIPFPESFIKAIKRRILQREYISVLNIVYAKSTAFKAIADIEVVKESDLQYGSLYGFSRDIELAFANYMYFAVTNKIEGMYAYDPVNEVCKADGSFSKKAKANRVSMLKYFNLVLGCTEFSELELRLVVKCYTHLRELGSYLVGVLDKYKLTLSDIPKCTPTEDNINCYRVLCVVASFRYNGIRDCQNFSSLTKTLHVRSIKSAKEIVEGITEKDVLDFLSSSSSTSNTDITGSLSYNVESATRAEVDELLLNIKNAKNDEKALELLKTTMVLDILETVNKYNTISEKQYFVLKKGYSKLDNLTNLNRRYILSNHKELRNKIQSIVTAVKDPDVRFKANEINAKFDAILNSVIKFNRVSDVQLKILLSCVEV